MASYFWIGGTTLDTGISGAAYDWNTPSNWRIISVFDGEPVSTIPDVCPGAGDSIYIGRNTVDGNDESKPYADLVTPKAPLLWGGYKTISVNSGTGTWIYGGITGTTLAISGNGLTGAINNIRITIGKNDVPEGLTSSTYSFRRIGIDLDTTVDEGRPLGGEQLASMLYNTLGLKEYSKSEWKTIIDQNKLSYSGLTGLFIKANKVQINSLPIPTNSSVYNHCNVNINWVDNVDTLYTLSSSPKYNTSATIITNANTITLKDAKFSNLYLNTSLSYYKTAEAGVRIIGSGAYLSLFSENLWYNLYIGKNNKIADANLGIIGAEYYSTQVDNLLNDTYVRSVYGYTVDNAYRPSKTISGTYSRSSVFSLFGLTSAGSTAYIGAVKSINLDLNGIALSADMDYHVPPSPFVGMRGSVTLMGITADGLIVFAQNSAPTHYFHWNPRTQQFECENQQTFSEPCSYGQLEDYIPVVLFTGLTNSINYMQLANVRLVPLIPWESTASDPKTQTFNIGKLELINSILETSTFGPNTIFWSDTDPYAFTYQQEPDWKFGTITNSSAGVTLDGGIVFGDEYSQVRGANGIRLLNYVVNKNTNKNNRTNTILNEIVGNKIPLISGGGGGAAEAQ